MSFLYPLGFLGLIAVPVLIIIYIIKNKYTEQVISSTYLWTLSEKFLKRKNPINRINGLLSLILQILAVVFISFAIAQPVFTLADAANDYCFILDGSGSMNIVQAEGSRFDIGKGEIRTLIEDSTNGSVYTLVYVGETTDVVYEGISDRDRAIERLDELTASYGTTGFVDAIGAVQEYFEQTPSLKIYLVTDKSYESTENVEVIDVSDSVENYALSEVGYTLSNGKLVIGGKAISYESDASLTIGLYVDGSEEPESTLTLDVAKLQPAEFSFTRDEVDFRSIEVVIENTDALAEDNQACIFNVRYDSSFTTLLVSDKPFFLQAALASLGNAQVDVVSSSDYAEQSGYGLYIFDSFTPSSMPKDGAVWFVNPNDNVAESGFSFQEDVSVNGAGKLTYSTSTSSKVRTLLSGVTRDNIYISDYVKCGFYRSFTTLLSYSGTPVLFVGSNTFGNREVVFAFDLHKSDIALSADFMVLINNLIGYTFPAIVDVSTFSCGDIAEINVLSNCTGIKVETPMGNVYNLDENQSVIEYELSEVGVYTITLMMGDASRQVNIFSAMPESERATVVTEQSFIISGEAGTDVRDGIYDDLIILFIILAILFIADWMVYCYEQYQLR